MIKNGGYTMLDLAVATYKDAQAAFNANKPILVYDNNQVYYADTCVYDSDNDAYVLTKGGKTITIDSSNNVISSGEIANPLMENIKDKNGDLRFIDGEGELAAITGVTFTYNKWSLSGTHLMFVLAGEVLNGTAITDLTQLVDYKLPKYIIDKIVPVASTRIDTKGVTFYSSTLATQTMNNVRLNKIDDETIRIYSGGLNLDTDKAFRLQFDLLIDAE